MECDIIFGKMYDAIYDCYDAVMGVSESIDNLESTMNDIREVLQEMSDKME